MSRFQPEDGKVWKVPAGRRGPKTYYTDVTPAMRRRMTVMFNEGLTDYEIKDALGIGMIAELELRGMMGLLRGTTAPGPEKMPYCKVSDAELAKAYAGRRY